MKLIKIKQFYPFVYCGHVDRASKIDFPLVIIGGVVNSSCVAHLPSDQGGILPLVTPGPLFPRRPYHPFGLCLLVLSSVCWKKMYVCMCIHVYMCAFVCVCLVCVCACVQLTIAHSSLLKRLCSLTSILTLS